MRGGSFLCPGAGGVWLGIIVDGALCWAGDRHLDPEGSILAKPVTTYDVDNHRLHTVDDLKAGLVVMRIAGRLVGAALLLCGVVGGCLLVGSSLNLPFNGNGRFEQGVGIPSVFTPEHHGGPPAVGTVTFKGKGVAELRDFPVGSVHNDEQGRPCMSWDGRSLFSGRATFTTNENLYATLDTREGKSIVAPYAPLLSDELAWYRIGVPMCFMPETTLWYVVEPH